MPKSYRNYSKTSRKPKRPFEKERIAGEMMLVGEYGLKNKKEVQRVQFTLSKIRKAARELLTLEANNPKRIFEGDALLKRLFRLGLIKEDEFKLDYVLGLTLSQFMDRRLQTVVVKRKMANSVHHARILIRQRHIAVQKQLVNIPSYMVRTASENHIQLAPNSVLKTNLPGRLKKKKAKGAAGGDDE